MRQIMIATAVVLFAFPAYAQEYGTLNEIVDDVCADRPEICAPDKHVNTLSHDAINDRIERATAVGMATDFHRSDVDQDNHIVLNVANFEFNGDATAFGMGYIRDFSNGMSGGLSFATDVHQKDQAVKATFGYSW